MTPDLKQRIERLYDFTEGNSEHEPSWDELTSEDQANFEAEAMATFQLLVPELFDGSHWLAPVEPTEGMEAAHYDAHARAETVFASVGEIWTAMRQAHMKEQEKE